MIVGGNFRLPENIQALQKTDENEYNHCYTLSFRVFRKKPFKIQKIAFSKIVLNIFSNPEIHDELPTLKRLLRPTPQLLYICGRHYEVLLLEGEASTKCDSDKVESKFISDNAVQSNVISDNIIQSNSLVFCYHEDGSKKLNACSLCIFRMVYF